MSKPRLFSITKMLQARQPVLIPKIISQKYRFISMTSVKSNVALFIQKY